MKSKISALMDGELSDHEIEGQWSRLREDGESLETWRRYHLIGDALRDTNILSNGFSTRFEARLAAEPTILAPARAVKPLEQRRHWVALSAAASLAAIALVGWLAFAPQTGFGPEIAQVTPQSVAKAPVAPAESANVPLPSETNDYLLAHQNYSPRSTLQGVAPYVRTVSDTTRP